MDREVTVNMTFKIPYKYLVVFEKEMRNTIKVVDYSVIPDTNELYENDATFRKLKSKEKEVKKEVYDYINKYNK